MPELSQHSPGLLVKLRYWISRHQPTELHLSPGQITLADSLFLEHPPVGFHRTRNITQAKETLCLMVENSSELRILAPLG